MVLNFEFLGKGLLTGFLIQAAPSMVKGAMKEFLQGLALSDFVAIVNADQNVWDMFWPDQQAAFLEVAPRLGPLDWLTAEWVLEVWRETSPSIYSALEGWPEGQEWLERQIEDIKERLGGS